MNQEKREFQAERSWIWQLLPGESACRLPHSFDKCSSTHDTESTMAVETTHGEGHGDNESVCQGRKTSQGDA